MMLMTRLWSTLYQKSTKFRTISINLHWPLSLSRTNTVNNDVTAWGGYSSYIISMLGMCDDSDDRTIIPIRIKNLQKSINFDQSTLTSRHLAQRLSTMMSMFEILIIWHKFILGYLWWLWWQDYHTHSYQKSTKFRTISIHLHWPLVISNRDWYQWHQCFRYL